MSWYYTEGTIQKIVVGGSGIRFSLIPTDEFSIKRDADKETDKKGILFINAEKSATWDVRAETAGQLFSSESIAADMLLHVKRDHLPVRIYVEDGTMVEVKCLEIKE